MSGFDISIDVCGDAQRLLAVFFVRNADIDVLDELRHHFRSGLAELPELAAVVEAARHDHAMLLGSLHRFHRKIGCALRERRSNAGEVEPLGTLKGSVPINVARLGFTDRRPLTVIDDVRRTLVRAALEVVDANPFALSCNVIGIDAHAPEFANQSSSTSTPAPTTPAHTRSPAAATSCSRAGISSPPNYTGSCLDDAYDLAAAHPDHASTVVVLSDFQLFDAAPDSTLDRLCRFPGSSHAVAVSAPIPDVLEGNSAISVTHVTWDSQPGEVARALVPALAGGR